MIWNKPLWSTFHLYGQDRTSNTGGIRSKKWYDSFHNSYAFIGLLSCMSYLLKPYVLYLLNITLATLAFDRISSPKTSVL